MKCLYMVSDEGAGGENEPARPAPRNGWWHYFDLEKQPVPFSYPAQLPCCQLLKTNSRE